MDLNSGDINLDKASCAGDSRTFARGTQDKFDNLISGFFQDAKSGRYEFVLTHLECGMDPNIVDRNGNTVLFFENDRKWNSDVASTMFLLLSKGANPNIRNKDNLTPFLFAVKSGCIEMIELLHKNAADIHATDEFGSTALHFAADTRNVPVLKWLLDAGMDLATTTTTALKQTPLMIAMDRGHDEIVDLITSHLAWDVRRERDELIVEATRHGRIEVVKAVLDAGIVSVTSRCAEGALFVASKGGMQDVVMLLLERGVDAAASDSAAVMAASAAGFYVISAMLMLYGASAKHHKQGPLLLRRGYFGAAEWLLTEGHTQLFFQYLNNAVNTTLKLEKPSRSWSILLSKTYKQPGPSIVKWTPLHIAVFELSASNETILFLLRMCPAAANIAYTARQLKVCPLIDAYYCNRTHEVLAHLVAATELRLFNQIIEQDYEPIYLLMLRSAFASDSSGTANTARNCFHLHFCGHGCAGKTTLVTSMFRGLNRNTLWKKINPLRASYVDDIALDNRTVGQTKEVVKSGETVWILHDYGGQEEYHVNHPQFLATIGSMYVVVIAVYDVITESVYELSTVSMYYRYWLRFINSVVAEDCKVPVATIINYNTSLKISTEPYVGELVRVAAQFANSRLMFIEQPVVTNAKHIDGSRAIHDNLLKETQAYLATAPRYQQSDLLRYLMQTKDAESWPPIVQLIEFKEEYLRNLIMKACELKKPGCFSRAKQQEDPRLLSLVEYLCATMLDQLTIAGEIVTVEEWVVTDVEWLTKELLGQIIKSFAITGKGNLKQTQLTLQQINTATASLRHKIPSESQTTIVELLVKLGLCIPVESSNKEKLWFPVFATRTSQPGDCDPLSLQDPTINGRHIVRRFALCDPERQLFPSGYFSKLFVELAAKYDKMRDQIFLYEDAMVMLFATGVGRGKAVVKVCDASRTAFELSLSFVYGAGEKLSFPTHAWQEFNRMREVIVNATSWMKNVPIKELFVNPANSNALTEEELYEGLNSEAFMVSEHMKIHLFGMKQGGLVADENLSTAEIHVTQLEKLMKRLDAVQASQREIIARQREAEGRAEQRYREGEEHAEMRHQEVLDAMDQQEQVQEDGVE